MQDAKRVIYRTFQRVRAGAQLQPGQFFRCHDFGGGLSTLALLRCTACLRVFAIKLDNPIDADGKPERQVTCSHCGERYDAQLLGWSTS